MAEQHPLPWRWLDFPDGSSALFDADGEHVLMAEVLPSPEDEENAYVRPASPYARAVTERAKALEQVVRAALPIIARAHDLPADLVPGPVYGAGRALIADIDAAKKEPGNG